LSAPPLFYIRWNFISKYLSARAPVNIAATIDFQKYIYVRAWLYTGPGQAIYMPDY